MPELLFSSVLATGTGGSFSIGSFLLCSLCSLLLGSIIALAYSFRNRSGKGFVITLALLPAVVQMVILLVNGNLGTGVVMMGAFSLVRFRSVPGRPRILPAFFLPWQRDLPREWATLRRRCIPPPYVWQTSFALS